MDINVTLFGQIVSFAIFVVFCMKYVWPPITTALQDRQKRIADGLAAAEEGSRKLREASEESAGLQKEAREQAQDIISNANRQAAETVEAAREEARSEAERIKASAESEADQLVNKAREDLRKQVGALAVAGASQILQREIDGSAHADILDKLATQL